MSLSRDYPARPVPLKDNCNQINETYTKKNTHTALNSCCQKVCVCVEEVFGFTTYPQKRKKKKGFQESFILFYIFWVIKGFQEAFMKQNSGTLCLS